MIVKNEKGESVYVSDDIIIVDNNNRLDNNEISLEDAGRAIDLKQRLRLMFDGILLRC